MVKGVKSKHIRLSRARQEQEFSPMSENRNLPVLFSVVGLFLVAVGVGLAYFGVAVPEQPTVQPFVGLGVVLALLGVILLIVAFAKMRPTRPVRWRTKKPQIEL
jgi:phosphatidylserine synthase